MALSETLISEIHRLRHEGLSARQIARRLQLGRDSVRKYLRQPYQKPIQRRRGSKLEPYRAQIEAILAGERGSGVSAVVILAQLRLHGYAGGISILRDYLRQRRPPVRPGRAFTRIEPGPGQRFDVDWAYFPSLEYQGTGRRLYAFVLVEAHSRVIYLEFTHWMHFESFVRCHLHAFRFLQGVAREIFYDNLATAVAERDGRLVRFQPRFLAFAQEAGFVPRAGNPAAGWEKGKVERAIGYVRRNFWPLRQFRDLADVNRQALAWLQETANQRTHRETGEVPARRFRPEALQSLPEPWPDYRDTAYPLVTKDLRVHFDGNRYCVPPACVGLQLTLRADERTVELFHDDRPVAAYPRVHGRGLTCGAGRFDRQWRDQHPGAVASLDQQAIRAQLGEAADEFLRRCLDNHRALRRQVAELSLLLRQYGPPAVTAAMAAATAGNAFGVDYLAAILRQRACPRHLQPPVEVRDPQLRQLAPSPPALQDYDAVILAKARRS